MDAENVDVGEEAQSIVAKEVPDQEIKNTKNSAFSFEVSSHEDIAR